MNTESVQQKYQTEIARLDAEHAELEQLWTQVPWFALCALFAVPAGVIWGWGASVVALLVSGALVGTRAYLIAVRKTENRWTRDKLLVDLDEQLEANAAASRPGMSAPVERTLRSVAA